MSYWYVIKTKPKQEERVKQQLQRVPFSVFLPKIRSFSARQTEHVANPFTTKPLFPSYLFIQADLTLPKNHRLIHYTRGVSRILGDVEGPQPISEVVMSTLMEHTKDDGLLEQKLLYKDGDEVMVKKGILKDLIGIIEKNMPETGRVKVLFKWLQGSCRAVVKYRDLEKVA